jgi:hypothetical protein
VNEVTAQAMDCARLAAETSDLLVRKSTTASIASIAKLLNQSSGDQDRCITKFVTLEEYDHLVQPKSFSMAELSRTVVTGEIVAASNIFFKEQHGRQRSGEVRNVRQGGLKLARVVVDRAKQGIRLFVFPEPLPCESAPVTH